MTTEPDQPTTAHEALVSGLLGALADDRAAIDAQLAAGAPCLFADEHARWGAFAITMRARADGFGPGSRAFYDRIHGVIVDCSTCGPGHLLLDPDEQQPGTDVTEAPAQVTCHFTKKLGEHPADARYTPCCSSHGKPLCCHHYRWSHFQETGCDCCDDGRAIRATMAAEVSR